ncbi:MAG: DNA polymerase III subunit delta [Saprospiraceae bacterium]|nr:DNA polymerase III subunit delta [Saprospiraceae bacterium]
MGDYQQILKAIKTGEFHPVYFLHGQEAYFIDQISDLLESKVLTEAEKSFNQTILYGKETTANTVIDSARRYPMMAQRQLVMVKEAQEMKELTDLEKYITNPLESTVLVICHKYKKHSLTGKFGKAVKASALVFESKPVYDNQMPDWIMSYLNGKKRKIDPGAARLVGEYLGTNLANVTNELEKLILNIPVGHQITDKEIEEHIGISREYNVFELQKALGFRDSGKAFRICKYFAANARKHPLVMIVGALYNYFSKIYMLKGLMAERKSEQEILKALGLRSSFFLREYNQAVKQYSRQQLEGVIHQLASYDLRSKGVDFNATTSDDEALYVELVWKILHEKVAS